MNRIILLLALCCSFCLKPGWSEPINETLYVSGSHNGHALALDPTNNKLYYGLNAGSNLAIYDLDGSGNPLPSPLIINEGDNTRSLALDTRRQRLYLATSDAGDEGILRVFALDAIGNTTGAGIEYDHYSGDANCLLINPIHDQLYIGINGAVNNLIIYQLDANGDPTTHMAYTSAGAVDSLALDLVRSKLYLGGTSQMATYNLDATGLPTGAPSIVAVGSSEIEALVLDPYRGKLHCSGSLESNIYTFTLDSSGDLDSGPAVTSVIGGVHGLALDTAKNRLYVGQSQLGWANLTSSGDIDGPLASLTGGSQIRAIIPDNQRQKLYTAAFSDSYYYDLDEPSEKVLSLNYDAVQTTQTEIAMQWRMPNPQYVLIDGASDLLTFSFPNTTTASSAFDTWIATGANRWANEVAVRAKSLTITAQVTSGNGLKTITVWFWGGSGASNPTGVMRRESAVIELTASTATSTVSPSPTYSPTPTPSDSETPTVTVSPTETVVTNDTMTTTATTTISATISSSPTASPTKTASATCTASASITLTLPPTHTPTPGKVFYLSDNRFNPAKQTLNIHVEWLNQESGELTIYTLTGQRIKSYVESAGPGKISDYQWAGHTEQGSVVASGVYYLVLHTNQRKEIKKVMVIK